jgi:Fe-S cluster biosynthesis and repair protein YggX
MNRITINTNKSIEVSFYLKKAEGFFLDITDFSSILSKYIFDNGSDYAFEKNQEGYFFYCNEKNLNLVKELLNDKNLINDFEKHINNKFNLNCNILKIDNEFDFSTDNLYFNSITIFIEFKEDVFNIPSNKFINEYIQQKYFQFYFDKYENKNKLRDDSIYTKFDLFLTLNNNFIFNFFIKIKLKKEFNFSEVNNTFNYNKTKTKINMEFDNDNLIFKGDIYEKNETLQWIK